MFTKGDVNYNRATETSAFSVYNDWPVQIGARGEEDHGLDVDLISTDDVDNSFLTR
jgi:hypothetical protein